MPYFNFASFSSFYHILKSFNDLNDIFLYSYEKIRVVGKGAFGNAVLYRRKDDALMCIIKEINMLDLNASDRQMALNEVKVLAKMDHPNIVAYHDSFEKDGILMIEMEYADGGNLAEFLAKQTVRLEEKDVLDILYQMVSAIRYMHAHHVLHRDLKTANIFLTKEGTVKIGKLIYLSVPFRAYQVSRTWIE